MFDLWLLEKAEWNKTFCVCLINLLSPPNFNFQAIIPQHLSQFGQEESKPIQLNMGIWQHMINFLIAHAKIQLRLDCHSLPWFMSVLFPFLHLVKLSLSLLSPSFELSISYLSKYIKETLTSSHFSIVTWRSSYLEWWWRRVVVLRIYILIMPETSPFIIILRHVSSSLSYCCCCSRYLHACKAFMRTEKRNGSWVVA